MAVSRARQGRDPGPGPATDRVWALVDAAVALSSTLDLDRVLTRIVRIASKVIGAKFGALGVLDEDGTGLSNFVYHGISKEQAKRIGPLPVGRGLLGALITDPEPIRLRDLGSDSRSVGFPDNHPPMRSFLGVPVVAKGRVFGNLYLTEKRGDEPFTEEDEALALALARQAGVAVENARLYRESRTSEAAAKRRVEFLTTIHEIGQELLVELDPNQVLRGIAHRARELLRAHSATVALAASEGTELTLEVVVGRGSRSAQGVRHPTAASVAGAVLASGEAARVDDLEGVPHVRYPIVDALQARSALFAPLFDRGSVIGVLGVTHRSPAHFSEEDLAVLSSFANLASLALQNARFFAAERERAEAESELAASRVREEMQAKLLREVIRAQEDERRRVSRDLHDSAGQALASILVGLKVAEQEETMPQMRGRIADLRKVAADATSELRRLALELRPTVLDDLGLVAALERYTRDFEERTGLGVRLRVEGAEERLDPELETVVYRVLQESLTNIAKYARAKRVHVLLTVTEKHTKLRVRDDGAGFDPAAPRTEGLGLRGMQERAGLVGGRVAVRSTPGKGTTVELVVPLPTQTEDPR